MFLYCDILLYMYSMLNEFIVIFMTDQCNIRPVISGGQTNVIINCHVLSSD